MAHTPGPWFAFNADYQRLHDHALLPIFVVGPEEFHTVAQVRAGSEDDDLPAQTKDNARLIAAAPDLLAALKSARDVVQEHATELLRSFCIIKDDKPDRDSMDDDERAGVTELESVLAEVDAAIAKAEPTS